MDTPALGSTAATGHAPMWGSSPASLSGTPPREPFAARTPSPLSTPSNLSCYLLCPPSADPPTPSASSHMPVFGPQRGASQNTALVAPFPHPLFSPSTTGHIPAARRFASWVLLLILPATPSKYVVKTSSPLSCLLSHPSPVAPPSFPLGRPPQAGQPVLSCLFSCRIPNLIFQQLLSLTHLPLPPAGSGSCLLAVLESVSPHQSWLRSNPPIPPFQSASCQPVAHSEHVGRAPLLLFWRKAEALNLVCRFSWLWSLPVSLPAWLPQTPHFPSDTPLCQPLCLKPRNPTLRPLGGKAFRPWVGSGCPWSSVHHHSGYCGVDAECLSRLLLWQEGSCCSQSPPAPCPYTLGTPYPLWMSGTTVGAPYLMAGNSGQKGSASQDSVHIIPMLIPWEKSI